MQKFNYIAKDRFGNVINDSMEAKSRYDVISSLRKSDLVILSVTAQFKTKGRKKKFGEETPDKKKSLFSRSSVKLGEFSTFCRQLSVCINSGINLIEGLQIIAEDMENPYFKEVLLDITDQIRGGKSFSEAIAKYDKIFKPIFRALIRAAEESGSMSMVLEYLATYLEKSVKLERKIRSITAYPTFVAGFFVIVILIVTFFVLPRFESMFASFHARLPMITQIVFSFNRIMIRNSPLIALAVAGLITGLVFYNRTEKGRYKIDMLKLKIILIGDLIRKASLARFCRIFSLMVMGGVPIVSALSITAEVVGNKVLEAGLGATKDEVMEGASISNSLRKNESFPKLMVRMIGIGESSGSLPKALENIADMYEDETEGAIAIMTAVFEPIVIVLFGAVILVLVLAIYVPIFTITMSIKAA